jgi:hypothetical protein
MVREAREQTMKELPPNTFDLDLFHERFAALVAAALRDEMWEKAMKLVADAVASEREACAKVCDAHTVDDVLVGVGIGQSCAAAIRARGNP